MRGLVIPGRTPKHLAGVLVLAAACGFDADANGTSLTATLGQPEGTTGTSDDGSTGAADSDPSTTTAAESSDGTHTTTESSPCGSGWWNDAWSRRTRMRFRGGLDDIDYDGAETNLSDMPVLVVLTPNRIDLDAVSPDGSDLRFVDVNGTQVLPHEIEHWDPTGTSWVWVRINTVPYLDDEYSFWVYYGNPDAPAMEADHEVWSSGYRGVWHLGEPEGLLHNSAEDLAHGDPGATAHEPSGKVAGARRFGGWGEDDQRVLLGPDSSGYFDGWSSFTLTLWVLPDYPDDEAWEGESPANVIHKGGPMNTGVVSRPAGAGLPPAEGLGRVRFRFEPDGTQVSRNVSLTRQEWSWIAYTFDGSMLRTFLDGVEIGSDRISGGALQAGLDEIRFGHHSQSLLGALDEVRFADTARSWVWLEAQYRSMTDQLLAYSNPESCP